MDHGEWMEAQDMLQEMRKARRRVSRISYDCMKLRVRGDRTYCELGKRLTTAKDGSLALEAAFKGYTPKICFTCPDFDGEEGGEEL